VSNRGGQDEPAFPGFDVLDDASRWDAVTQGVVLSRVGPPPPIRFFTPEEERVARPLVDRLVDNDEPRLPLLEAIDQRLVDNEGPGYRNADMPEYREAWRQSCRFVDEDAVERFGVHFWELHEADQRAVLEAVRTAKDWHGLPASEVWTMWIGWACTALYSHPTAWNEIGFPGPAYPRGYAALGLDSKDSWEARERNARDRVPWAERLEAARRRHAPGGEDP